MWRLLGKDLTDQQRSLIGERLRSADKELAKKGLKAGYRVGEVLPKVEAASGGAATLAATAGPGASGLAATIAAVSSPSGRMVVVPSPRGGLETLARSVDVASLAAGTSRFAAGSVSASYQHVSSSSSSASAAAFSGVAAPGGGLLHAQHRPATAPASAARQQQQQTAVVRAQQHHHTAAGSGSPIQTLNKNSVEGLQHDFERCLAQLAGPDMGEVSGST